MLSGVLIDPKKEIISGVVGRTSIPVFFTNINQVYDSIWNDKAYQKYLGENYNKFHPKFREIIGKK